MMSTSGGNRNPTIYNVMSDFGAKGDGVTDDSPAFQAAINKCAADGGSIYVPAPSVYYRIYASGSPSFSLTHNSGYAIRMFGDDMERSRLYGPVGAPVIIQSKVDGDVFEDIWFSSEASGAQIMDMEPPTVGYLFRCKFDNVVVWENVTAVSLNYPAGSNQVAYSLAGCTIFNSLLPSIDCNSPGAIMHLINCGISGLYAYGGAGVTAHLTDCHIDNAAVAPLLTDGASGSKLTVNITGGRATLGSNGLIGTGPVVGHIRGLDGYNPVGPVTVSVPSSGSAVAAEPYDRVFYIVAADTGSSVSVDGSGAINLVNGQVISVAVPANSTLTPTYTSSPSWVVVGN